MNLYKGNREGKKSKQEVYLVSKNKGNKVYFGD